MSSEKGVVKIGKFLTSRPPLSGSMKRWIGYYLGYCILILFVYFGLVSIALFFHNLLDHRLAVMEEWTLRHGHHLIIITKILVGGAILRILTPVGEESLIWRSWRRFKIFPERTFFLVTTYFVFMIIWVLRGHSFQRPVSEHFLAIHAPSYFIAYCGTIVFYLVDALLLSHFCLLYPLKKLQERFMAYLIIMTICILTTKLLFPHSKEVVMLVLHLGILMVWLEFNRGIGIDFLLYLMILVAPLSVVLGQDIVWGDLFSLFRAPESEHLREFVTIWGVAFIYLFLKNRDKFLIGTKENRL